ncbi:MAG: DUF3997 domain-containing protein [Candidatus Lokiarchaeota archaeon]|nr:DUF3997 domain-containing protein [Candidatus Lokiarchaeota archaeon]
MSRYCFTIIFLSILFGCVNPAHRPKDLGNGYQLILNGVDDRGIVDDREIFAIYGHVVDYRFDSVYIIAIERPRDSVPECDGLPWQEQNKIFYASSFKQYWIINKINGQKWGPYNYQKYLLRRREIGVPEDLKLSTNYNSRSY